jgi:RNA polymerase sigma factor (sigma-70 family)
MTNVSKRISLTLIREAQQGRSESIALLSEEVREMLCVYLYRITLDYHLAQDLCQETLLEMIKNLPKLTITHPRFLRAWLFKTATSKVHKHLRKKRPRSVADLNATGKVPPSGEGQGLHRIEQQELSQTVTQALRRLKPRHRTILTLRCYEELSYKEIVTIVGGSEMQAKLLFFRAKGCLKRQLHRSGFDASYLLPALSAFAAVTAGTGKKVAAATAATVNPATVEVATSTALVGSLVNAAGVTLVALVTVGSVQWTTKALHPQSRPEDVSSIQVLEPNLVSRVNAMITPLAADYTHLNVGIIQDAQLVFTQSYGQNPQLDRICPYYSISKPITALICLQLREQGQLPSLDTPIQDLVPRFRNSMPPAYVDTSVTLRHLLTHSSGLSRPPGARIWQGKHLKLAFRPGSDMSYSSPGYKLLGEILEHVTGMSYAQLVREHVAEPLNLTTLTVEGYSAGFTGCYSHIEDFGRLIVGVMQGKLVPRHILLEQAFKPYRRNYGLGWFVEFDDSHDLIVRHGGGDIGLEDSAVVIMRPHANNGVVLFGQRRTGHVLPELKTLGRDLLALLR